MAEFVAILLFIVIGVLLVTQWNNRQKVLARIAHHYQGEVEPRGWSYSRVHLRVAERPATLSFESVGDGEVHTRLTLAWPDSLLRCEIYPQGVFSGLRKLFGVEDIEIGSPPFDAAFIITGNNKTTIRELVSPAVQSLITRLAQMKAPHAFSSRIIFIKWGGGELVVNKPYDLTTYESLEEFIGLTSELVLQLLGGTGGIKFVSETEPRSSNSQCQVCGEPLVVDLVYCPGCRTPHHRECWEYFGGCSTYACGKRAYVFRV